MALGFAPLNLDEHNQYDYQLSFNQNNYTLDTSPTLSETNKNEIEISAAAMPPSYLFNAKSKKCEEIMIEGLPLGGLKDEKFTMLKKSFQKGDVLVMLSDGLPEASDENNEMYDATSMRNGGTLIPL